MMGLLLSLKVFVFIFCILHVLKTIYTFFKVLYLESGSLDNGKNSSLFFGLSLSYILTLLIMGF